MMKKIFLLLILPILLPAMRALAGNIEYSSRLMGTAVTTGAVFYTHDDQYTAMIAGVCTCARH